ncbi:hypothetical protein, partial [Zemynaea arenosa]|uniref:hypothetical protein n=1 Tax=Zemynaea arenosa TaxID=2561931 RepID=UPI001C7059DB
MSDQSKKPSSASPDRSPSASSSRNASSAGSSSTSPQGGAGARGQGALSLADQLRAARPLVAAQQKPAAVEDAAP